MMRNESIDICSDYIYNVTNHSVEHFLCFYMRSDGQRDGRIDQMTSIDTTYLYNCRRIETFEISQSSIFSGFSVKK